MSVEEFVATPALDEHRTVLVEAELFAHLHLTKSEQHLLGHFTTP